MKPFDLKSINIFLVLLIITSITIFACSCSKQTNLDNYNDEETINILLVNKDNINQLCNNYNKFVEDITNKTTNDGASTSSDETSYNKEDGIESCGFGWDFYRPAEEADYLLAYGKMLINNVASYAKNLNVWEPTYWRTEWLITYNDSKNELTLENRQYGPYLPDTLDFEYIRIISSYNFDNKIIINIDSLSITNDIESIQCVRYIEDKSLTYTWQTYYENEIQTTYLIDDLTGQNKNTLVLCTHCAYDNYQYGETTGCIEHYYNKDNIYILDTYHFDKNGLTGFGGKTIYTGDFIDSIKLANIQNYSNSYSECRFNMYLFDGWSNFTYSNDTDGHINGGVTIDDIDIPLYNTIPGSNYAMFALGYHCPEIIFSENKLLTKNELDNVLDYLGMNIDYSSPYVSAFNEVFDNDGNLRFNQLDFISGLDELDFSNFYNLEYIMHNWVYDLSLEKLKSLRDTTTDSMLAQPIKSSILNPFSSLKISINIQDSNIIIDRYELNVMKQSVVMTTNTEYKFYLVIRQEYDYNQFVESYVLIDSFVYKGNKIHLNGSVNIDLSNYSIDEKTSLYFVAGIDFSGYGFSIIFDYQNIVDTNTIQQKALFGKNFQITYNDKMIKLLQL